MLQQWLQNGALLGLGSNRVLLGLGASRRLSAPPAGAAAFYAPDFFLEDAEPWIQFETVRETSIAELESGLTSLAAEPVALSWESAFGEDEFRASFEDLATAFRSGALEKGVPVVFENAQVEMAPAFRARLVLAALTYARSLPVHVYGFWDAREGILGATPEMLLSRDERGWATMALAGTRRDGDTERGPLMQDAKELREHRLVIDGIARAVAPFGSAEAGITGTVRLPGLAHLHTPIRLETSAAPADLIRALHPTPALGASPREEGMKWLHARDRAASVPRRRFGAPFGVLTPNRALFVVAIRCAQWAGDRLRLGAGCGVIAESEFAREWKEIQAKLRAVRGILGL